MPAASSTDGCSAMTCIKHVMKFKKPLMSRVSQMVNFDELKLGPHRFGNKMHDADIQILIDVFIVVDNVSSILILFM
jgi:hypothetical protein